MTDGLEKGIDIGGRRKSYVSFVRCNIIVVSWSRCCNNLYSAAHYHNQPTRVRTHLNKALKEKTIIWTTVAILHTSPSPSSPSPKEHKPGPTRDITHNFYSKQSNPIQIASPHQSITPFPSSHPSHHGKKGLSSPAPKGQKFRQCPGPQGNI